MKGNFQIIIVIVFIALAIFGVLVFSGAIPIGGDNAPGSMGTVVLWGTVRATTMAPILEEFNKANQTFTVQYVEKFAETFNEDLLEALAVGVGPDMFFLPDNLIFHYANKITTIPYQSYPLSAFKNNFVGAGEVFLTPNGMLAFPLAVDPLVMYYNRSMLDGSGIVFPPTYWDEMLELTPVLTKKDDSNRILKSAVALGNYSNIAHAKDIVSTLFMQTGNPIVKEKNGTFVSDLSSSIVQYNLPAVLKFYTDFANPVLSIYSWNRSFPNSNDAFSREDVAFYFGYGSELQFLVNKNPNQNFLVAPFPQVRNANSKLTGAHVTGIALSSASLNFNTAFVAASLMSTGNFASSFAAATGTAPARRDLLNLQPADAYSPTLYESALFARGWIDPSPLDTNDIFRRMIDGVLSGAVTPGDAVRNAHNQLNLLLLR
ncbi:MAG: extracellular solute-binding protein [Candidatus Paceibacterota bacterium]